MFTLVSSLALAGCMAGEVGSAGTQASAEAPGAAAPRSAVEARPGGVVRDGTAIVTMSDQYAHPRAGAVAAAGASAWVPPAPAPAFVAEAPLPVADAPPPPLAAVANRQPASPATPAPSTPAPSTPASDLVRPEAAAPSAPVAASVDRDSARAIFNDWSCGACHVLADAGASGSIGPALDGNSRLTRASAITVITNGQGAMPAFGGQLTDEEIAELADYIVAVKK